MNSDDRSDAQVPPEDDVWVVASAQPGGDDTAISYCSTSWTYMD
jgi:hypothetical protein